MPADESAIEFFRLLLKVIDPDERPLAWAEAADGLATQLLNDDSPGHGRSVDRAVCVYLRALRLRRRAGTPELAALTEHNLARAYGLRTRGDPAVNADRAIRLYERALRVRTRDRLPREWRLTMNNLAAEYRARPGGDPAANADRAIALFDELLASLDGSEEPDFRCDATYNLAVAWRNRPHGDPAENVERAVEWFGQALAAVPPGDGARRARILTGLANALQVRPRGDAAENQERAIELYRAALRSRHIGGRERARITNNLAVLYRERVHGAKSQNVEHALRLLRRSLRVRTRADDPVEWARTCGNLGNVLQDRRRGDRARNLERAIHAYEQALEVQRPETLPLEWAQTANNLAACYSIRRDGDRGANLRRAVELLTATLALRPRDAVPLAWAESHDNLGRVHERALNAGVEADPAPAVAAYTAALEVMRPDVLPAACREVARRLGKLQARHGRWSAAAGAYRLALEAAEALHRRALLPAGREAVLARTPTLFAEAGYALLRAGHLREGAVALERGRARALGEALARDRAELSLLRRTHPELHARFQAAVLAARAVEARARSHRARFARGAWANDAELRAGAQEARAELDSAVAAIAMLPGMSGFLGTAGLEGIEAAVRARAPLVYLAATGWGSVALVLSRERAATPVRCEPLWVDGVTADAVNALLGARERGQGYAAAQSGDLDALDRALTAVMDALPPLLAPVAARLAELGARTVVLLPGGHLSGLPLHAVPAGVGPDALALGDRFAVSYAPSARVLAAARRNAARPAAASIFAVADPAGDWRPLECAADEVEAVRRHFPAAAVRVASGRKATRAAVRRGVGGASYLHFACHAVFDDDDPLASYLLLAGGERLTLEEVLATRLEGARLVVLSACQTAVHDSRRLPDEAVGMAAGFLQAGAAGVVATLWPVDDFSASLLIARFYHNLFARRMPPAAALAAAQRWLRRLTDEALGRLLEAEPAVRRPRALHPRGTHTRSPGATGEFADPFHWAAFVFVGA